MKYPIIMSAVWATIRQKSSILLPTWPSSEVEALQAQYRGPLKEGELALLPLYMHHLFIGPHAFLHFLAQALRSLRQGGWVRVYGALSGGALNVTVSDFLASG